MPDNIEYPTNFFCEKMQKHMLALYRFIWVHTHEEQRATTEIIRAIELLRKRPTYTDKRVSFCYGEWTLTKGIRAWAKPSVEDPSGLDDSDRPEALESDADETRDPSEAIRWVENCRQNVVVVFKDMHAVLSDPGVCRTMRDFISSSDAMQKKQQAGKIIVVVSPVLDIPVELEKSVTIIDFSLPTDQELNEKLASIIQTISRKRALRAKEESTTPIPFDPSKETQEETVKSGRGLTIQEFENAVARSMAESKGKLVPAIIQEEKKQIVLKNGVLEQLEPATMNDVGGMDSLKGWLAERHAGWSEEGRAYGLRAPRGILLLGVQGCGKSLVGKAIASQWGLPLYKLDVGKLFNQTVGSSESRTRNVLKTIEGVAPAVMLIDEIDKGLSGVNSSNFSDGGTTARVVGTILTWMQEHRSEVFIVATANSIQGLPPELLRKGRFDEVFFVDLPTEEEREDMFKIHFRKIGRDAKKNKFDTQRMARLTPRFSGAEIESIVETALVKSFPVKQLRETHIIEAIENTVPLWKTKQEDITELLNWVGYDEEKGDGVRARFASSKRTAKEDKDTNVLDLKK